ncbi:MAG: sigma-54 dependent transcriptional regulator [Pseudomonadota bacterium]
MKNIIVSTRRRDVAAAIKESLAVGDQFTFVSDADAVLERLQGHFFDILFLELEGMNGHATRKDMISATRDLLESFSAVQPGMEVVVMAPAEHVRDAVMAVKVGASNYLTHPIDTEEVRLIISEIGEGAIIQSELKHLRDESWATVSDDSVGTRCDNMKLVLKQIQSVAATRSTVLLCGETGTGKTRLAKLIHHYSHRNQGPFISIHCGAIPDTLLESELFGHEKGAFTGAIRMKRGKFEVARGGTLFLDEIGTITAAAQIKLLTVIQEGEFSRVGGELALRTDVRLVAATNMDLKSLVDAGAFRKDLFYRLNVFPIYAPPLRERKADIPLLVDAFINRFNRLNNKRIHGVYPQVMTALQQYGWPGNIRELQNVIERAHILESGDALAPESFPQEIVQSGHTASLPLDMSKTLADVRRQAVEETEHQYLKELVSRNKGRINISAAEAGISTRQLNKLLNRYGIYKETFKPGHADAAS